MFVERKMRCDAGHITTRQLTLGNGLANIMLKLLGSPGGNKDTSKID
jgi:hypothetical protein